MRIARTIVIPAILALGATGSLLSVSAVSVTAQPSASVHVQALAGSVSPRMTYEA
jgi:hypothetical protein